jgi:di/tricarboxylate transporter
MGLKIAYVGVLVAVIFAAALWGTPRQTGFVVLIWIAGGVALRAFDHRKTQP